MVAFNILLLATLAGAKCFEPTVAHPPPILDPNDDVLRKAFVNISTSLAATASQFKSTSFSVDITSSEESLWNYQHAAAIRNASGVVEVNGDSVYRLGSCTKVFTVLGMLYLHKQGKLNIDAPINYYMPELGDQSPGGIEWANITVRTLASQLSDLPRECMVTNGKASTPTGQCYTAQDLQEALSTAQPLLAPKEKSSYSNLAFVLLGSIISRATNQTYESYMNDAVLTSLEMSKSSFKTPDVNVGVIPSLPNAWDLDEGIQKPTGGLYSSSTDLSKFLRHILNNYNTLTKDLNWINPTSPSGGLNSFYGMPWEILQTDRVLENTKRTVRFITKTGDVAGYESMIIMLPEYGIGISILSAGDTTLLWQTLDQITIPLVRAAEEVAIRQLNEQYAGSYKWGNSSLTIVADARGLVINNWVSNSTDVLKQYPGMPLLPSDKWYPQLVPTNRFRNEKTKSGEEWRILPVAERKQGFSEIWDDFCVEDYDHQLVRNVVKLNGAVFWKEQVNGSSCVSLELAAYGRNSTRIS